MGVPAIGVVKYFDVIKRPGVPPLGLDESFALCAHT